MLDAEKLKETLLYDPVSGDFFWLAHYRGVTRGKRASGNKRLGRYTRIRIDGEGYRACRLAYLYMTGTWPPNVMDHINGEPSDDRWENLRPATVAQNMANTRLTRARNLPRGVSQSFDAYRATISGVHLGRFATIEEAAAAYKAAVADRFGEFAAKDLPVPQPALFVKSSCGNGHPIEPGKVCVICKRLAMRDHRARQAARDGRTIISRPYRRMEETKRTPPLVAELVRNRCEP